MMMKPENKLKIGIGTLLVMIVVLTMVILTQKAEYKNAIETKDHFVDSLRTCLDEKEGLNKELDTFQDFFWNNECENRTFKGHIELGYGVMNWLDDGYQCDIQRITSEKPDNAHKDSRWRSLIDCYECNAP